MNTTFLAITLEVMAFYCLFFVMSETKQLTFANWFSNITNREKTHSMGKYPAGNYMFKVNNRNTRARCEICSKLTIKIPE